MKRHSFADIPFPTVSVVMPLYNEERHIESCLDSLLEQSYPQDKMEWILVDGGSEDRTLELLEHYRKKYPQLIKILNNPERIVPYAMNYGIEAATGDILIRLDAHASYAPDYIETCVEVLKETGADNVGGVMETKAKSPMGQRIADVLSSPFGVGNSKFRTSGEDGYVDTVPFGAYPRTLFAEIGGYDTRLVRNQDNELNYRIRANGGKIFLSNQIKLAYYCRDTLTGLTKQARLNGKWTILTSKFVPGSMGLRHFVPLLFLLSLIVLPLLSILHPFFGYLLLIELILYAGLDLYASFQGNATKPKDIFIKFWIYPLYHLSYGIGSIQGLWSLRTIQDE